MAFFSRPIFLGCIVLLLLIATIDGKGPKKHKPKHQPKCKTYRPPKSGGGHGGHSRGKRLVGGTVGDIRAMPWLVYIESTYQIPGTATRPPFMGFAQCTGSLISRRHVLTASHCLQKHRMQDNNTVSVRYGAANLTEGTLIMLNKTAGYINPDYTSVHDPVAGVFYDYKGLAIIDLGQDLEFDDNVHSICLSCLNGSYPQGTGIVAGWGDIHGACHKGVPSVYPKVFRYGNSTFQPCLTTGFTTVADLVCSYADSQHSIGGRDSGGPFIAPVGPSGDYMQVCVNGANNCNPRENACTRIYGDWVEEVTGVKCQPYVPPSQCEE